ncbi:MAG: rhodanese-like domain-containing protein [Pseudomonadota bacterium]
MQQYIEFASNHPVMIGLFLFLLVLLGLGEWRRKATGAKALSPLLATAIINDDESIVLDVRPSGEFKTGHISGAVNISYSELSDRLDEIDNNVERPVLICCKGGMHSPDAARLLKQKGFQHLYVLSGGITAWKADNMPLEK